MAPSEKRPHPEQTQTDESLREERARTDDAYARKQHVIEGGADTVVGLARARADTVLDKARALSDERLTGKGVAQEDFDILKAARAQEDAALHEERATADRKLEEEREAGRRALASLLRLERHTTDGHLLVERTRSDESLTARDDFLAMVCHDVRTLLGGVAMRASMLVKVAPEGAPGQAVRRNAEAIEHFTARMNRLIGDLLDVASIEAGQLPVHPRPGDAVRLVRETVRLFQPTAAAQGLRLESSVAADTLPACFDHERVLQVLANLVSNALKFTPEGGRVALHVESQGDDVRISVSDTGVGISADMQERVFERFWQVREGDKRGLGLGLYISQSIARAHGGRISVESTPGKGSTFSFTLPGACTPS